MSNRNSIGNCMRRWNLLHFDLAGFRVEPSNNIRFLGCEPENSVLIEYRGMRVVRSIRQVILTDLSSLRIQLADVSLRDCREPNVPFAVRNQSVWSGARSFQRKFRKFAGIGIKSAKLVRRLPRVPKKSVPSDCRIMGARVWRRHVVFLDQDLR